MQTLEGHFGAALKSQQCNVLGDKELTMETNKAHKSTKKKNGVDKGVHFGVDNEQREGDKGFCDFDVITKQGPCCEGRCNAFCERVCAR
jgi:hypothetical protein